MDRQELRDKQNFFKKVYKSLDRLFSTGVIVRHAGGKKLKVIDTDSIQQVNKTYDFYNRLVRYSKNYNPTIFQQNYSHNRLTLYRDYDLMDCDPILSCISGDTKVATLAGFIPISLLTQKYKDNETFEVWCWDNQKCKYTIGQAHHPRKTGTKKVIQLYFDNGKMLKCTPDHKILLSDGTYKQAQYLTIDDSLRPFKSQKSNNVISNFKPLNTIEEKKLHNFLLKNNNYIKYWDYVTIQKVLIHAKEYSNLRQFVQFLRANNSNIVKFHTIEQLQSKLEQVIYGCGYKDFYDYKQNVIEWQNVNTTKIIDNNQYIDVYDLTVDYFENFCLQNQIIVSNSAMDIYADQSVTTDQYGDILKIKSSDEDIKQILSNLFYDVLNIDFNLWTWIRNLPVKYDTYIPLLNGENITIEQLSKRIKNGQQLFVYSIKDDTKQIVPGKVIWCDKNTSQKKIVKITLDDKTYVQTAPSHPFILRDGSRKRADQLLSGDSLMPFYRKKQLIKMGLKSNNSDYQMIYNPAEYDYTFTHRLIAKSSITKNDKNDKITHHIDFNRFNNSPTNLKYMSYKDHFLYHSQKCKTFLHNQQNTKKRLAGIDRYLRSDYHKQMMRQKMTGFYKRTFKQYNESTLHTEHNKIRSEKMKQHWANPDKAQQYSQSFRNYYSNHIILYLLIEKIRHWTKRPTIFQFVDAVKDDKYFIDVLSSFKLNKRKTVFNVDILQNIITDFGYKNYPDFCNQHYVSNNHKVKQVQIVEDDSDVYCMTVVGLNGQHDRHNFAVCGKNANGQISTNSGVFVENCKYGDCFIYLDLDPEYGIINCRPISPYQLQRIQGENEKNPYQYYFRVIGSNSADKIKNYQIAHFRVLADTNFLPYGRSVLQPARRAWKQLTLMIDAMLVHRIMRAPEKRVFKIDIGDIPTNKVEEYVTGVINKMKKVPYVDPYTGQYNLKYNVQNILEDFYLPIRGKEDGSSIDTLPGMEYNTIDDINFVKDIMLAALKIPRAFLTFEQQINAKCLHPDTRIKLLDGRVLTIKQIADIYAADPNIILETITFDIQKRQFVPTTIKWCAVTRRNAELVRVHIDNDTHVDCTPDHKFLLADGSLCMAKDLQPGTSLQRFDITYSSLGYPRIFQPNLNKKMPLHIMVDRYYNGSVDSNGIDEDGVYHKDDLIIVHHKDFNKDNNSTSNLIRMTNKEHLDLHVENILKYGRDPQVVRRAVETKRKPWYRQFMSQLVKQRIKNRPELHKKMMDGLHKWFANNPDRPLHGFVAYSKQKRSQIATACYSQQKAQKMLAGYRKKYPNGRPDISKQNHYRWINRPTFQEITQLAEQLEECESINDFSMKLGFEFRTLRPILKQNGYTIDEFFNKYFGFRPGRPKILKREDFIQLVSTYKSFEDFANSKKYSIGKRARPNFIQYVGEDSLKFAGSKYNHKVVSVQNLDQKVDTYNMEINHLSHTILLNDCGIVIKQSTLSQEDFRFSRTIERLQKIVISQLYKIAIIHLYINGYKDSSMTDFELSLHNPSIVRQQQNVQLWDMRVNLAKNMLDTKHFSSDFIYDKVYGFTEEQKKNNRIGVLRDMEFMSKLQQYGMQSQYGGMGGLGGYGGGMSGFDMGGGMGGMPMGGQQFGGPGAELPGAEGAGGAPNLDVVSSELDNITGAPNQSIDRTIEPRPKRSKRMYDRRKDNSLLDSNPLKQKFKDDDPMSIK